jgi:hypothetical protein
MGCKAAARLWARFSAIGSKVAQSSNMRMLAEQYVQQTISTHAYVKCFECATPGCMKVA